MVSSTPSNSHLPPQLRRCGNRERGDPHPSEHARQRLRRAHELFDLDLDDPAQRLLLEIELAAAA
jgi:hypothetical protein